MKYILGIDECSTGSWAGPVYSCGVLAPEDWSFDGIDDSKKLTKNQRKILANKLKASGVKYFISNKSSKFLDENILGPTLKIMYNEIIDNFADYSPEIYIDGSPKKDLHGKPNFLIKGDSKIKQIMAASIIAKDARDTEMADLAKLYPNYNFESNAGYGRPDHIEAISKYGLCDIHRYSYKPIKKYAEENCKHS